MFPIVTNPKLGAYSAGGAGGANQGYANPNGNAGNLDYGQGDWGNLSGYATMGSGDNALAGYPPLTGSQNQTQQGQAVPQSYIDANLTVQSCWQQAVEQTEQEAQNGTLSSALGGTSNSTGTNSSYATELNGIMSQLNAMSAGGSNTDQISGLQSQCQSLLSEVNSGVNDPNMGTEISSLQTSVDGLNNANSMAGLDDTSDTTGDSGDA